MNIFEKILSFLKFEMNTPTNYGWFHIMCLFIMTLIILVLYIKRPNLKKTILTMSTIMILFEIYKQLSFSFWDGAWHYQWYIFPFQFCSVPMYVGLIAGLTKNKKIENACYSFLATYGLIAGISVMLYPNDVYIKEALINIQTMIHHGFMVIMGIYILLTSKVNFNTKTILNALTIFSLIVFIALLIDVSTYYLNIDGGLKMFFISPFHASTLPVFSIIYNKTPYIIFLLIYIVIFTIGAIIPLVIKRGYKK